LLCKRMIGGGLQQGGSTAWKTTTEERVLFCLNQTLASASFTDN